jgi:hypothetical protein
MPLAGIAFGMRTDSSPQDTVHDHLSLLLRRDNQGRVTPQWWRTDIVLLVQDLRPPLGAGRLGVELRLGGVELEDGLGEMLEPASRRRISSQEEGITWEGTIKSRRSPGGNLNGDLSLAMLGYFFGAMTELVFPQRAPA